MPDTCCVEESGQLRKEYNAAQEDDEQELQLSLRRMGTRGVSSAADVDRSSVEQTETDVNSSRMVSPEERKVEETITRGFLSHRGDSDPDGEGFTGDVGAGGAKIEIGLAHAKLIRSPMIRAHHQGLH